MHRVTRATLGTVAIGLVAVFLVAGMVGGGLLGAIHMPGQTAKGSPAGAASKGAAPLTPARTYWTQFNTLNWWDATLLGSTSPVPASFQFYANITWGPIDNTHTKAYVQAWNDSGIVPTLWKTFSLNGTINTSNVVSNWNNGVWYSNYTWTIGLNETTLGCSTASCAGTIPLGNNVPFFFTVYVTENGASFGGGLASDSLSTPTDTVLVVTYVNAGFISPSTFLSAVPFDVQFFTNTSWGYTGNSSTNVSLEVDIGAMAPLNFSFNGTVNSTNANGFSSALGWNGTVGGVLYTYAVWTMTLNETTIGCTDVSCNTTLLLGMDTFFYVWANVSGGYGAGGFAPVSGPQMAGYTEAIIGSTLINAGVNTAALPYQPLPYVESGWVNMSWVNPAVTNGNSTITGYVLVWDTATLSYIANISLANGVNTTNANGTSFMVAINGTTPSGIPYENYTWTWTLSADAFSLGAVVPYDPLELWVNLTAHGGGYGGVENWLPGGGNVYVDGATFVQYPTTAAVAFTSTFSAYMPIPVVVNYTVTVANAPLSAMTTTILVNVTDTSAGALLTSTAVPVVDNQTAYTFSVDASTLLCNNAACTGLPQDEFKVSVFIGVDGIAGATNGSLSSMLISKSFFLIPTALSASLVSPVPGAAVSVGNVTVSVAYIGSWVSSANINIYAASGAIVFTHSMIELTPGVPVAATWFVGQPGTYSYSIVMQTVYLPTIHYFNGTLTVTTKGGNVYTNTTQWSNQSIISGLTGAVAGTILLVVGLIVGMIVALVLARAVMGRPAQAPPQPWESKPGAAGAAPNTCSVCGKSFATPEELAAHGKAEHGMQ